MECQYFQYFGVVVAIVHHLHKQDRVTCYVKAILMINMYIYIYIYIVIQYIIKEVTTQFTRTLLWLYQIKVVGFPNFPMA